jgi:hypothetical protein
MVISMSGKANGFDNAMVETFFKTLKAELVRRTVFRTRTEATAEIGRYIDGFYNPLSPPRCGDCAKASSRPMATRRRPSARLVAVVDITIAEHLAIHEAILNGSPAKARQAMERHIINAAKRVGLTLSSNE